MFRRQSVCGDTSLFCRQNKTISIKEHCWDTLVKSEQSRRLVDTLYQCLNLKCLLFYISKLNPGITTVIPGSGM